MNFATRFKIEANKLAVQRPHNSVISDPVHLTSPTVNRNSTNTKVSNSQEKAWWLKLNQKSEEKYLKQHPRSRKVKQLREQKERERIEHLTQEQHNPTLNSPAQEETTPEKKYNIIYPKITENNKAEIAEWEAKRNAEANKAKKINQLNNVGHSKSLSFMLRHGVIDLSKEQKKDMEKADIAKHDKAYKNWMSSFGKLDLDDLEEVADKYYQKNPNIAKTDGVIIDSSIEHDYLPDNNEDSPLVENYDNDESNSEQENTIDADKDIIEQNPPTKVAKKFKRNFDTAFNTDPFKGMNKKERNKRIAKSVSYIGHAFQANTKDIVTNTYKLLPPEQIQALTDLDNELKQHLIKYKANKASKINNVNSKFKLRLTKPSARLCKMVFVAVATAAALALGGLPLGLLCMNHSLTLSGHEGRAHELIWKSLNGKNVDNKSSTTYNIHDDPVEIVVKSLKNQLAHTYDKEDREKIEELIEENEQSKIKSKNKRNRKKPLKHNH